LPVCFNHLENFFSPAFFLPVIELVIVGEEAITISLEVPSFPRSVEVEVSDFLFFFFAGFLLSSFQSFL